MVKAGIGGWGLAELAGGGEVLVATDGEVVAELFGIDVVGEAEVFEGFEVVAEGGVDDAEEEVGVDAFEVGPVHEVCGLVWGSVVGGFGVCRCVYERVDWVHTPWSGVGEWDRVIVFSQP